MIYKKIHNLILFSFFFFSIFTQSQTKAIDSLKIELEKHQQKDTTHVNLLYSLAYANFRRDIQKTKAYLKQAAVVSDSLNYKKGKAKVFYLRGILENIKSNYTKSLYFFKKSLNHYESINDKKGVADVHIAFGITNSDLSQYNEAIKNYKKAAKVYKELGSKREIVTSLINVGNIYSETGRYKEAIANFKEALILSEIIKDEDGVSYVHSNLGVVYSRQGNYPLAIESYNKSLEYDRKTNDTLGMARMFHNLGETYTSITKYDKALNYHKKSLNFLSKTSYKPLIAANNSNIGAIYLRKKEYTKALEYFEMSLKINQEIKSLKQSVICYVKIGNIYALQNKPLIAREYYTKAKEISIKINDKLSLSASLLGISETYLKRKKYKKALFYAKEGKKNAEELGALVNKKQAEEILSNIYKNTGQYKKALESYQLYKIFNDSLFNKENIEKIAQIEYEYKYKQALDSASIRELKLTKTVLTTSKDLEKSQRNYLWAIIGFLLVSLVSGAIIFQQKYRNTKTKMQNVVIEQKLLRSQMTPHFIFNSLSVLQGMILNKEAKKSVLYLSKFSKLLRIILENSRDKTVLLSEELKAVENYLVLQNLENELYNYTVLVDDALDVSQFKIPPMLIQPFVENAVEHAFVNEENRKINVYLVYKNENLICTITDNGIGIDSQKEKKNNTKKSLSTTITTERLQMLSNDFKIRGSVIVEDLKKYNKQGTLVTMIIPYKKT